VGLIAFSRSTSLWLSMPLLVATGFGMIVHMAASNTVIQTLVDEDKRGRVMSFYTMAFFGTTPLGSLIAGAMARSVGAPATLSIGGATCVAAALAFARALPAIRRDPRVSAVTPA